MGLWVPKHELLRPSRLVRARADVLTRRGLLAGAVGLGVAMVPGMGQNGGPAMAAPFRLRRHRHAPGGNNIPADAILISTAAAFSTAIYTGADGANYVLDATTTWASGDFGIFGARTSKVPGVNASVNFYMQPGTIIPWVFLDTCKCVSFNYMGVTGGDPSQGNTGWGASNSDGIVFNHITVGGAGQTGITLSDCDKCTVSWAIASDCGIGASFRRATNLTVENVLIQRHAKDAFDFLGCTDAAMNMCMAYNPGDPSGDHQDTCQIASVAGTRNLRVSVTNCVYDRATSAFPAQGLGFCESGDHITIQNCASRGAPDNGLQFSDCTESLAQNVYMNSWDFSPRVRVRDASVNCTADQIYAPSPCEDLTGGGANTNTVFTNQHSISLLSSSADRGGFDTFVATNGLPTPAYWDGRGFL